MSEFSDSSSGSVLITTVTDWLMLQALGRASVEDIFDGCCQRLDAAGVPVSRAMLTFRTLHPLYSSSIIFWRRGEEVSTSRTRHEDAFSSEEFRRSPIFYMFNHQTPFIRRKLKGDIAQLDFPVLEELREQGATDYLAFKVAFTSDPEPRQYDRGIIGSWTTDRPSGFTDQDLVWLMRVQSRLAVACKTQIQEDVTHNVLDAYLGRDAGHRVMEGQIRRGDGECIQAVIWYSDMRDSTPWADRLSADEFLALVNSYFECSAGAVIAKGGDVLRFVGDAVLAIFPIEDGGDSAQAAACRALDAAKYAHKALAELNERRRHDGEDPVDFGLGLHVGEVTFGNIGVPERLEFSVVGPAANEVARLESLTKSLQRRIVVSADFAELVELEWESLGTQRLRGVSSEVEIFSPPGVEPPTHYV